MISNFFNKAIIFCCYAALVLLVISHTGNGFFWDTVLYASQHGNFFYQTQFSCLLVPDEMDCGSIPAFGVYIALAWQFFGRTLLVSHLAMIPFVIGFVWQLQRFLGKFIAKDWVGFAMLLLLCDSTILSQVTLISPDLAFLFFFFLATNAALENRKLILALAVICLFLINTRGVLVSLCILLLDLHSNVRFRDKWRCVVVSLLKRSLIYLPALFIFVAYYTWHYLEKDWIFRHEGSPWKIAESSGVRNFVFNIVLIAWRVLDYGKIIIWIFVLGFAIRIKGKILKLKNITALLFLIVCIIFIMHLSLLSTNLFAHRYFLPFNLCFGGFCAAILFSDLVTQRWRCPLILVWLAVLLSGNFWIYPEKVSQGWDSTLAHLPYYGLRHEAIHYLDEQHIDFNEVQSFFPNVATIDKIDLNKDQRHFSNFDGKSNYVFYSNVFNVADVDQDFIKRHYTIVKNFESKGVFITIYRKR